ncbi:hypothetical protein N7507_010518 [Penicillium longicatenatum]|nr:hypothetical protein N7507_010518 [Penicillium longicatenatum]
MISAKLYLELERKQRMILVRALYHTVLQVVLVVWLRTTKSLKQEGIIRFEMEGASLRDIIPTIVVKGVCDYVDGHKGKEWQLNAAAAAAACAKCMLKNWTGTSRPIEDKSGYKEPVPSAIHQVFSVNLTKRHP